MPVPKVSVLERVGCINVKKKKEMLNFLIILIIPLIQFRQGMAPCAILKIAEHCLLINS